MAGALPNGDPLKQAVEKAKDAFSRLPNGDQVFLKCINSPFSIVEAVEEIQASQKGRKSARVLEGLQKYTSWLQNLSSVVDVAVQTQAGVTCPVWAPLKFVLQVVQDNSRASEEIARLLETLAGCIRKIQLFEELGLDPTLQIPLLELFADVVDFSVKALEYFGRRGFLQEK
ncbi:putative nacht domain protein [Diplodia seriata]|uniref:Putative nacht domain protein n=1 Tax=Diplodia seriata TaxID=420778 RepID=A0A0G2E8M9_9PEZI|nr:putative nacht domain protein [Diplodia seriata]